MSLSLEAALDKAEAHLVKGEIGEAHKIFCSILIIFPKNERAKKGFEKSHQGFASISVPELMTPDDKIREIISLYNQGQFLEVIQKAKEMARYLAPNIMLFNLIAAAHAELKNLDQAIENFHRVLEINPQDAVAYFNIGNINKEKKEYDTEIINYKKALEIKPDYAECYNNMGSALKCKGDLNAAIDSFKMAIKIKANFATAHYNLGVALQEKGDVLGSIKSYRKACKFKPDYIKAYFNMGNALKESGDFKAAIDSYKQSIIIKPDYAEAYNNLGIVLSNKCELGLAIENYRIAIKINPNYPEAYLNMGNSLKDLGEINGALESFQRAIEIKPDYVDANFNQSLALLYKRDFKNGWAQYEWRLKKEKRKNIPLRSTKPTWNFSNLANVLLWAEQGVGDEIMFASIILDLHAYCSKLSVQIDRRLIPLFKRSFPEDIVFWPSDEIVPEAAYDAHIPIGSLPQYFRQSIDSFRPTAKGWLNASDKITRSLREQLLSDGTETLIGISWHSTKPRSGAEKKVIALNKLAKKLHKPGVKLVNLQYGDVDSEIGKLQNEFGIKVIQVPDISNKDDIDDLAALIMACDKIVSISNVTAHLAGALGKEAQVLLPFSCDWRWGIVGNSSNWYSSVCLYRQTRFGDWDGALLKL